MPGIRIEGQARPAQTGTSPAQGITGDPFGGMSLSQLNGLFTGSVGMSDNVRTQLQMTAQRNMDTTAAAVRSGSFGPPPSFIPPGGGGPSWLPPGTTPFSAWNPASRGAFPNARATDSNYNYIMSGARLNAGAENRNNDAVYNTSRRMADWENNNRGYVMSGVRLNANAENRNNDAVYSRSRRMAEWDNNNRNYTLASARANATAENSNRDTIYRNVRAAATAENNDRSYTMSGARANATAENSNRDTIYRNVRAAAAYENRDRDMAATQVRREADYENQDRKLAEARKHRMDLEIRQEADYENRDRDLALAKKRHDMDEVRRAADYDNSNFDRAKDATRRMADYDNRQFDAAARAQAAAVRGPGFFARMDDYITGAGDSGGGGRSGSFGGGGRRGGGGGGFHGGGGGFRRLAGMGGFGIAGGLLAGAAMGPVGWALDAAAVLGLGAYELATLPQHIGGIESSMLGSAQIATDFTGGMMAMGRAGGFAGSQGISSLYKGMGKAPPWMAALGLGPGEAMRMVQQFGIVPQSGGGGFIPGQSILKTYPQPKQYPPVDYPSMTIYGTEGEGLTHHSFAGQGMGLSYPRVGPGRASELITGSPTPYSHSAEGVEDLAAALGAVGFSPGLSGIGDNARGSINQAAKYGMVAPTGTGIRSYAANLSEIMESAVARGMDRASVLHSIDAGIAMAAHSGAGGISTGGISDYLMRFSNLPGGRTGELGLAAMGGLNSAMDQVGSSPIHTMMAVQAAKGLKTEADVKALLGDSYDSVASTPEGQKAISLMLSSNKKGNSFAAATYLNALTRSNPAAQQKILSQSGFYSGLSAENRPIAISNITGQPLLVSMAANDPANAGRSTSAPGSVPQGNTWSLNYDRTKDPSFYEGALLRMGVRKDLVGEVIAQAEKNNVNPLLMGGVIMNESTGGRDKTAGVNVMQIDPSSGMPVPQTEAQSIAEGAQHLAKDIEGARGDFGGTLRSYNGPGMKKSYAQGVANNMVIGGQTGNIPDFLGTTAEAHQSIMDGAMNAMGQMTTIIPNVNAGLGAMTKAISDATNAFLNFTRTVNRSAPN